MTEQSNPKERATLYKKIAAVTAAVSRIPKNGENTFHRYKYATESDITDGLRALLQENGLAFLPPSVLAYERDEVVDNPKLGPRTRVQVQFALGCADTGEMFTAVLWGEGQDNADKGFYKAYTGAVKYFLMKTFLIATGDDPERDDTPPPRQQFAQQRETAQKPAQRAANGNGTSPAEARRKFYDKWGDTAGTTWAMVQGFLQIDAPEPTTVEGWREVWTRVQKRAQEIEFEQVEAN